MINIPHDEISISLIPLSVPSEVIVVFAIVCRALLMSDAISISAKVITEANQNTIVKNNRTRFFIDMLVLVILCVLNILDSEKK
ncbi:MAG: hypothetical protein WCH65_05310 [bacterium]